MKIIKIAALNLAKETWTYGPVYIVRGDTYPVRQTLSNLGFKWSGPQKGWYMPESRFLQILPSIKDKLINLGISFSNEPFSGTAPGPSSAPTFSAPLSATPKQEILEGEEYPPKGEENSSARASEMKTRERYKFPVRKNILQFSTAFTLKDDPELHTENVVVNRYFKPGITSDTWKVTFNAEYAAYPMYQMKIGRSVIEDKPIITISKSLLKEGKPWGSYDEKSTIETELKKFLDEQIPIKWPKNFQIEYDYRKRDPELIELLKSIEGQIWDKKNKFTTIKLTHPQYGGDFPVCVLYSPPLLVEAYPNVDHPQAPKTSFRKKLFEISLYKVRTREELEKKITDALVSDEAKAKYVEYLDSFPYVSGENKPGYQEFLKVVDIISAPEAHAAEVLGKIRSMGYVRESLRAKGVTIIDTKKVYDDLSVRDPGIDYLYTVVAYQINYFHKRYNERAFTQWNLSGFIYALRDVLKKYDDVATNTDLFGAVEKLGEICFENIFGKKRSKSTWENYKDFYSGAWGDDTAGEKPPATQETSISALQMLKELAEINDIPVSDIRTEAKKVYHMLAMKLHPDKNPENIVEATEQFKELGRIWDRIPDDIKNAGTWYSRFILG